MGRKSRYETHVEPYLGKVREWYQVLNEGEIAKKLGISAVTFEKYKREHPELLTALREGRRELIEDLKLTLKKKAKGYEYEETKTLIKQEGGKEIKVVEKYKKYAQPDTGAIHLLLKNLDDTWRNDDRETMDLKREKLKLDREKMDNSW